MGSSLRPISSNLTKSLFYAGSASSRPKPNLRSCIIRRYATVFDQSRLSSRMIMEPYMSSTLRLVDKGKYFNLDCPGLGLQKTESHEGLCVFLNIHGLKKEDLKASVDNNNVLTITGDKNEEKYYAFIRLPVNVDNTNRMIDHTETQDGMFKVTLPKVKDKDKELKKTSNFTNIIARCKNEARRRFIRSVTFARMHIFIRLGRQLFESFTVCKKETAKSLHVSLMRGIDKTEELPSEGLCVSLNMPELKIDDVKSFVIFDFLFIEGISKTNKVHYITGICIPMYYERRRSMIKTEMQDGMFKITLPKAKHMYRTSIFSSIADFVSKQLCIVHGSNGWYSRIVMRLNILVFERIGPQKRWTKYLPNELEIEFPVCGLDSEADIDMQVDVKNRLMLIAKNGRDRYYEYYQQLPRCGNFEKAEFKSKVFAGLLTLNVKNFQSHHYTCLSHCIMEGEEGNLSTKEVIKRINSIMTSRSN